MNDSIKMTGNQFQQKVSVELTGNFSDTFSTGNILKFSVTY